MTYTITVNPDGTTTIDVDFTDETVNLQGQTSVKGGEAEALSYLHFFEADLRRNFADLFPASEVPPGGGF
jgi:hypothetical protein